METNELESQSPETEQDPTADLQAQIKSLRSQLKLTQSEQQKSQSVIARLTDELNTVSTGDVEQIRQAFDARFQELQHNAGMSSLKAALVNHSPDYAELSDAIVLKGGKRFGALDDGSIVLFDPDGTPAINGKGRYISPAEAAQTVITKLGGSTGNNASTSGLKPYSFSADGKLLVPRSEAAHGGSEYTKQMRSEAAQKAWSEGNIRVLPDSAFQAALTAPIAQQIARKQSESNLTITRAELQNSRDWCRKHNVDPAKFSAMLNSDRIKVVA